MDKNDLRLESGTVNKPYDSYLSGEYLQKNPTWDDEDSEWKAGKVLELIRKNELEFESIADVGCGAGGVLASLSGHLPGVKLFGFEVAPDASQFWSQHDGKEIQFRVDDFCRESTQKFDVIMVLDVIEHVPDPFEFLTAIRARADYYIFHIPLDLSSLSVAREKPLLKVREKVGHIHYYTKNLAIALLNECGYGIIDWSYTGACFSAPQTTWASRLARVPRRLLYSIDRDFGVRVLGGDTLIVLAGPS